MLASMARRRRNESVGSKVGDNSHTDSLAIVASVKSESQQQKIRLEVENILKTLECKNAGSCQRSR